MRWFGAKQLEILRVLWRRGRATAREITDDLNSAPAAEKSLVAHSTVQTLLRELEGKGAVAHEAEDRTFVFYPLIAENEVRDSALGDLIQAVFQGSAHSLVTHLLGRERLSSEEIKRLRGLLDDMEEKQ